MSVLRDVVGAEAASERGCPGPFSVFAAESDRVVPRASAQGAFPDCAALPGDHFSVVQPRSREDTAYVTLSHLLREEVSGSDPPGVPPVTVPRATHRPWDTRRHRVVAPRNRKRRAGVQRCHAGHCTPS
ncbi:hypothetical protein [Streptomyces lunaelactis]|uniref:hypothetical protein n=1 Tax=Streptomyces lunaelactis TaxID=1535768 RepID=UPI001472C9FC|nr:hypothetical protein [Streptomyces lunaelactis]NUK86966.1 hypothetical protein [Streptomyces lunaelactis]